MAKIHGSTSKTVAPCCQSGISCSASLWNFLHAFTCAQFKVRRKQLGTDSCRSDRCSGQNRDVKPILLSSTTNFFFRAQASETNTWSWVLGSWIDSAGGGVVPKFGLKRERRSGKYGAHPARAYPCCFVCGARTESCFRTVSIYVKYPIHFVS